MLNSGLAKIIPVLLLSCAVSAGGISACSSRSESPQTVTQSAQIPMDFPVHAEKTLRMLSDSVSEDASMLVFGSYGSLAAAISQFQKWGIVSDEDFSKTLSDLEMHYLLNPSKLSSWYKAGFNTSSGFVGGMYGNSLFVAMDIADVQAFKKWLENFFTEEFGRPMLTDMSIDGKSCIHIETMNHDTATLVMMDKSSAVLILGSVFYGTDDSVETAKKYISSSTIGSSKINAIGSEVLNAPIAVWTKTDNRIAGSILDSGQFTSWISHISAGIDSTESGPDMRISGVLASTEYMNQPRESYVQALLTGDDGGWTNSIIQSAPTSLVQIPFDAEMLENLVLPQLSAKDRSSYKNIKDKLTQKLIRLDVTDQVIHNLGSAWVAMYGNAPARAGLDDLGNLNAHQTVIYLPMKKASKAESFFSKINVLKGAIPGDKATITNDGNILHAVIRMDNNQNIHVGYANGLIVVATASAWKKASGVLNSTKADNVIMTNGLSMKIHPTDPIIDQYIGDMKSFKDILLEANVSNNRLNVHFKAAK